MVASNAVHTLGSQRNAAENIATAHHDSNLNTFARDRSDFVSQRLHLFAVDAKRLWTGHGFAAELQEDAFVFGH